MRRSQKHGNFFICWITDMNLKRTCKRYHECNKAGESSYPWKRWNLKSQESLIWIYFKSKHFICWCEIQPKLYTSPRTMKAQTAMRVSVVKIFMNNAYYQVSSVSCSHRYGMFISDVVRKRDEDIKILTWTMNLTLPSLCVNKREERNDLDST